MSDLSKMSSLVERARHGDQGALKDLLCRYQSQLLAEVRADLGDELRRRLESGDVLQDAIVKALQQLPRFEFRTENEFLGYLIDVVRSTVREWGRHWHAEKRDLAKEVSLAKKSSAGSENPFNEVAGSGTTPSKVAMRREDISRLQRAMGQLRQDRPDYFDLIVAVDYEQRSYGEVAAAKGANVDAVRMKLQRGRVALAKIYRKLQGGGDQ